MIKCFNFLNEISMFQWIWPPDYAVSTWHVSDGKCLCKLFIRLFTRSAFRNNLRIINYSKYFSLNVVVHAWLCHGNIKAQRTHTRTHTHTDTARHDPNSGIAANMFPTCSPNMHSHATAEECVSLRFTHCPVKSTNISLFWSKFDFAQTLNKCGWVQIWSSTFSQTWKTDQFSTADQNHYSFHN